jgi:hypothetical protein
VLGLCGRQLCGALCVRVARRCGTACLYLPRGVRPADRQQRRRAETPGSAPAQKQASPTALGHASSAARQPNSAPARSPTAHACGPAIVATAGKLVARRHSRKRRKTRVFFFAKTRAVLAKPTAAAVRVHRFSKGAAPPRLPRSKTGHEPWRPILFYSQQSKAAPDAGPLRGTRVGQPASPTRAPSPTPPHLLRERLALRALSRLRLRLRRGERPRERERERLRPRP